MTRCLEYPCVNSLITNGEIRSRRSIGAQIIAIACKIDGISKQGAIMIGYKYHTNCSENKDFKFNEIEKWIRWAYEKKDDEIFWNCNLLKNHDKCILTKPNGYKQALKLLCSYEPNNQFYQSLAKCKELSEKQLKCIEIDYRNKICKIRSQKSE